MLTTHRRIFVRTKFALLIKLSALSAIPVAEPLSNETAIYNNPESAVPQRFFLRPCCGRPVRRRARCGGAASPIGSNASANPLPPGSGNSSADAGGISRRRNGRSARCTRDKSPDRRGWKFSDRSRLSSRPRINSRGCVGERENRNIYDGVRGQQNLSRNHKSSTRCSGKLYPPGSHPGPDLPEAL